MNFFGALLFLQVFQTVMQSLQGLLDAECPPVAVVSKVNPGAVGKLINKLVAACIKRWLIIHATTADFLLVTKHAAVMPRQNSSLHSCCQPA